MFHLFLIVRFSGVLNTAFLPLPMANLPDFNGFTKSQMESANAEYTKLKEKMKFGDFRELITNLTETCSDVIETCLDVGRKTK